MVLTTTFHLRQPGEYLFANFPLIFKQMKHKYNFRGHINGKNQKNLGLSYSENACWRIDILLIRELRGKRENLRWTRKNLQRFICRAYLKTDVDFQFKLSGKKGGKNGKTFLEAMAFATETESCFEARSSCHWEIWK